MERKELKTATNTAKAVREKLLSRSDEIIDTVIDIALGKNTEEFKGSVDLLETVYKSIVPLIKMNDDKMTTTTPDLGEDATKADYVNLILREMAAGNITTEQANASLSAIEKATNVIEIQEIVKKLNALEGNETT